MQPRMMHAAPTPWPPPSKPRRRLMPEQIRIDPRFRQLPHAALRTGPEHGRASTTHDPRPPPRALPRLPDPPRCTVPAITPGNGPETPPDEPARRTPRLSRSIPILVERRRDPRAASFAPSRRRHGETSSITVRSGHEIRRPHPGARPHDLPPIRQSCVPRPDTPSSNRQRTDHKPPRRSPPPAPARSSRATRCCTPRRRNAAAVSAPGDHATAPSSPSNRRRKASSAPEAPRPVPACATHGMPRAANPSRPAIPLACGRLPRPLAALQRDEPPPRPGGCRRRRQASRHVIRVSTAIDRPGKPQPRHIRPGQQRSG